MRIGRNNLLLPPVPASLKLLLVTSSDSETYGSEYFDISRSTRSQLFCKKSVLQNFANFQLCRSLFFNNVAGLRPSSCNVIGKDSGAGVSL